jgi:hypothetical protein
MPKNPTLYSDCIFKSLDSGCMMKIEEETWLSQEVGLVVHMLL